MALTKLDAALALAGEGWSVFPIVPNGKTPAIGAWQQQATTDPATIREWWGVDANRNIGVAVNLPVIGKHVAVLDVDVKDGGPQTLADLDALYGEPGWQDTYTVETPSGGLHLYFLTPEPLATTARRLGAGLDTRGGGPDGGAGYVVAPGSTIGDKAYRVLVDKPIRSIPTWLAGMIGAPRAKSKEAPQVVGELDTAFAKARAAEYLQHNAPLAVEGAGGDDTTFKVAARVMDFGISESECLGLMAEHWNPRCSPPWREDELASKVTNAAAYRSRPVGASSVSPSDFQPVKRSSIDPAGEAFSAPGAQPRRLHFVRFAEISLAQTAAPLVTRWLDQGALSVMYGGSNVGKSFLALDIAFHVATGRDWYAETVESGAVVYVAAESPGSILRRIVGIRRKHSLDGTDLPLAVVPCPVDLRAAKGDTDELIALINEAAAAYGVPVRLVVIDTLARAMMGGDENAGEDMGALIAHADRIRQATGAHVMLIHHAGKDEGKGARGHSSLRAAVDTEIVVKDWIAEVTKQRDGATGIRVGFGLEFVSLDERGPDGFPIQVPVAIHKDAPGARREAPLKGQLREVFDALALALDEHGQPAPADLGLDSVTVVAKSDWQTSYWASAPEGKRKTVQQAFNRQFDKLVQDGLVCEQGGWVWFAC